METMSNLFLIFLTLQISLKICYGSPLNLKSPNFRVLEEPRSVSYHEQNFETDLINRYRSVDEAKIIQLLKTPTVSGNEARFSLQNNRHRGKRPNGPSRRQDVTEAPTKLDITSVSPIQSSLGGLTGLQGLPPLSLIQFVKLLVAVTPFIIPIIFVPLLIFTLGMFMIPVNKKNYFIGGDDAFRQTRSSTSWSNWGSNVMIPSLTSFAKKVANHEECIERFTCEIGRKYLPQESGKSSILNRTVLQRVLNYFNHPLLHRISRSLQTSPDACVTKNCRATTFLENNFFRMHETKQKASEILSS